MSQLDAAAEEAEAVLELLQDQERAERNASISSIGSGKGSSQSTVPRVSAQPKRTMILDVSGKPVPVPASMTGESSYLGNPVARPVRSMIDLANPPSSPKHISRSEHASPIEASHNSHQHRSLSDASSRPASFGVQGGMGSSAESNYQIVGHVPTNLDGPVLPKRNSQTPGWAKMLYPSAMAEVVRGSDLSTFGSKDRGRNHSVGSSGLRKSMSPARWGLRSSSPKPGNKQLLLPNGQSIDAATAHRRLSDANLASSRGILSELPVVKRKQRSNSSAASDDAQLEKDISPTSPGLVDSSDDESPSSGSDSARARGRAKTADENTSKMIPLESAIVKKPRPPLSLSAAAEEERLQIVAQQRSRSLSDPAITLTGPSGEKAKFNSITKKPIVHPHTSFDIPTGRNTPVTSDAEADITDIKRAQKLSLNMTSISSTLATSRSVRTLYRGDFSKMQTEANEGKRRVRKYLVATDLSSEAAHALEWAIGTVLRDGDTLLAIYCVDEEVGIAPLAEDEDEQMKEQATAIANSAKPCPTPILGPVPVPSPLGSGFRHDPSSQSANSSPMGRLRSKPEQERYKAVQDITDRVAGLLRKTKLQVKVVIEVIHCKSPKHLITEVIDHINPTLVILGSRGRTALKSSILGSFSNYLVTKSSVPVMVARKRLRKHSRRPHVRQANNLDSNAIPQAGSIVTAKID